MIKKVFQTDFKISKNEKDNLAIGLSFLQYYRKVKGFMYSLDFCPILASYFAIMFN